MRQYCILFITQKKEKYYTNFVWYNKDCVNKRNFLPQTENGTYAQWAFLYVFIINKTKSNTWLKDRL